MTCKTTWLLLTALLTLQSAVLGAASGKVIKVLPFFLDLEGRQSLSPSLFDRDAYQAQLRKQPAQRSGLRVDVQWKAADASNLKVKVELRGMKDKNPITQTLEAPAKTGGILGNWTTLTLGDDDFKKFGELSAWRATLWDGDQLLGEQKSFLW